MERISPALTGLWTSARWPLVVSVAPVAFGSTYWVTAEYLPAETPLWGSAIRALPAGVALMLLARRLPSGAWWWRAPILGTLNMGLFFCLLYVSAQLLPAGVAASMCCVSPFMITAFAWMILGQRPSGRPLFAAAAGVAGVLLIVGTSTLALDFWGVLASVVAMTLSSAGAVLMRRWDDDVPLLAVTSWQLVFGGLELAVLAVLFEGPPPQLQLIEVGAFAYLSLVATALAFACWFVGFRHLPAAAVGVIGLLNPIVGVALGFFLAGETLSPLQVCGIALIVGSVGVANARSSRSRRLNAANKPKFARFFAPTIRSR